jgi:hypothetical protein
VSGDTALSPKQPRLTRRSSEPFNGLSLIVLFRYAPLHASRQSYGPLSFGVGLKIWRFKRPAEVKGRIGVEGTAGTVQNTSSMAISPDKTMALRAHGPAEKVPGPDATESRPRNTESGLGRLSWSVGIHPQPGRNGGPARPRPTTGLRDQPSRRSKRCNALSINGLRDNP